MKNIKYFLFTIASFLLCLSSISASNSINKIDVDIYINKNGSASITEVWDMQVDSGTEVYKPMGDLGNSKISHFIVSDESGKFYTYSSWNVDDSFSQKSYKNGYNYTTSGIELCWGMSSYGSHTYVISYDVSNFVFNTSDAQVVYWKIINDSMDPAPKNIYVKISSYYSFPDTLDVWGFGYGGYAYVKNGAIELSNKENNFKPSQYAVALIKFPLGTFNSTNSYSKFSDFNSVLTMAQNGTTNSLTIEKIFTLFATFITSFPFLIIVLTIVIGIKKKKKAKIDYVFSNETDKLHDNEINNFRDIPCKKDLFRTNTIAQIYKLQNKNENIVGAILLNWILNDKVAIVNLPDTFFKKNRIGIDLKESVFTNNESEKVLYEIMKKASKDNILESYELEKWCRTNYSKLFNWINDLNFNESNKLALEGLLIDEKKKLSTSFIVNYSLKKEGLELAGMKKFLEEFSMINEKAAIEVKLWKEYLIYAQIFGIADKVAKQFKNLYPEISEVKEYDFDNVMGNILLVNAMTSNGFSVADAAREAAQNYSAGGGGFSSFGGGGGSFGGGSGGGCR